MSNARRMPKRRAPRWLIALVVAAIALPMTGVGLGVTAFWLWWNDPHSRHFDFPLPAGSTLVEYESFRSGFELKYGFVYRVPDNQLRDTLIARWHLVPAPASASGEPIDTLDGRAAWWPSSRLKTLPEAYHLSKYSDQRYWSVWIDRDNDLIYVQYGRW